MPGCLNWRSLDSTIFSILALSSAICSCLNGPMLCVFLHSKKQLCLVSGRAWVSPYMAWFGVPSVRFQFPRGRRMSLSLSVCQSYAWNVFSCGLFLMNLLALHHVLLLLRLVSYFYTHLLPTVVL
ncbi:hypothetical protein BU26DRAFT_278691 [Trematosphaeria pertusa]|uniref:Uncharacterized protein n=1 Tax=Trematosphaeria pertusa TaxID=390896 RepID=A0A6A6INZ3_9PLEO|nr:uncharacterized protein BU26DRAFT_278691 [Trematosphaeria pertusa]KAF2251213.1 hypothetical protein BU26DRAFT_278691 [Trematosphaeria pertusa]